MPIALAMGLGMRAVGHGGRGLAVVSTLGVIGLLAAGEGSRMGGVPKCLLSLSGRSLLGRQCAAMRDAGARVRLIPDGDVAGSLMPIRPGTGIDLLWGVGGTPEGVLSAAAIRSVGGRIIGRLWPRTDDERAAIAIAKFCCD